MDEDKRIPRDANSFEAGGRTYIIYGSVPIERYTVMQELEVRSAYGATYAQLHRAYKDWTDMKNKGRGHEADVKMSNTFEGVNRKTNKQYDPILLICTLFMCEKDEDRTTWSEEQANEKIKVWSKEGYPTEDFLRWGLHFVRLYQVGFNEDSQSISEVSNE